MSLSVTPNIIFGSDDIKNPLPFLEEYAIFLTTLPSSVRVNY